MSRSNAAKPHLRRLVCVLAFLAAPAAAKELPVRPDAPLTPKVVGEFTQLADQIGWGSLFQTELMRGADTSYGGAPWIMVTASPYLPITYLLESRAWAAQRLLSEDDANARLLEIIVDPAQAMWFSVLIVAADERDLEGASLRAEFDDGVHGALPARLVGYEVAPERTMGGTLFAGRGRLEVEFPAGHDWSAVQSFKLRVFPAGAPPYTLSWEIPKAP